MQNEPLTRQSWHQAVRDSGVRLEVIAVATGKSYSAVYRYLNGSRNPSEEWIAQVSAFLAGRQSRGAA